MHEEIRDICLEFVDALIEGDYDRAANWAFPPLSVVAAMDQRILEDHTAIASDLEAMWAPYANCGTLLMRPNILATRSFSPGLVQADIEWHQVDTQGKPARQIFSTYTMRRIDGRLKVVQVVSHNEMLHRPIG